MKTGFARNAVVLGLLAAVGPFSIDTYLPALPTIAVDLGAPIGATQASLMAFFAAVGLCQVVYGPISDMAGRRPPLYFGLALFVAGSIGCSFSSSIETLIAFRFVQGVGACAAMIIPRAIVRDLHTGPDAARLMSLIMLVFSVSPILAPLSGSALIAVGGWRSIFDAIAVLGILGIALVAFALPETRPREMRIGASMATTLAGYTRLLRDRYYLGVVLIGGCGLASFFTFLASSSFVYVEHFGLTPTQYSFAFSVNAIGFIGAAQFSGALTQRYGFGPVVRVAVAGFAAMVVTLFVVTLAGIDLLPVLMTMLFLGFACLGLVIPTTAVMSLEAHGEIAGMAAAMMGTIQMLTGAAAIVLVSVFFDGTSLPMVTAIAICAICAFVLSRAIIRPRARVAQPAE
jgi:DHA1 family bicyclomycin/chloramphenicol resistance-like MFS transporter